MANQKLWIPSLLFPDNSGWEGAKGLSSPQYTRIPQEWEKFLHSCTKATPVIFFWVFLRHSVIFYSIYFGLSNSASTARCVYTVRSQCQWNKLAANENGNTQNEKRWVCIKNSILTIHQKSCCHAHLTHSLCVYVWVCEFMSM